MGFDYSFVVCSNNFGGGLALLWSTNMSVTLHSYNIYHIDVDIKVGSKD